ncbi:spliceosome component, nuclear pre-mRNA splicing factor [Coccomyxa subellipsoidea C-169]|uniref:Pre-mRNA-processing factor 19 n=1 Tax=Coccomyxa subellipsoidea (strain C-169) TaxID=574566 RepID=I0YL39_COCSC|nr:spliceosome component, nuclear pre-mRNA splicing factor [Coccomyxa subellipsoidea C-169]EIE19108.1 spliceosome component, nuclear pre-mRNA splicing factor [Coccomyxa subellipsoidea C-169]|eukprot:XP_005643652.1 spliceosome component, nuclear pre-mRNA splicing factor [Coccomyxa subellipsoidea C-169]
MFCSISGTVPEEPVINRSNGQLFEKRLIEKHVQETGKDPITGEPASLEDLLPVKTNKAVKPRPSAATSIPGLLGLFHNEWDALMLESHQQRIALIQSRQELSHALYQQDAACRVIARLTRERDEARSQLENAVAVARSDLANGKRTAEVEGEEEQPAKRAGIPAEVSSEMLEHSKALSKGRKKRIMPASLATPQDIEAFSLISSHPLHKSTKGGILSIDVAQDNENLLATGGADSVVVLFDREASRIRASLTGHTKKINSVKFFKDSSLLVSASADHTARMWRANEDGSYSAAHVLTDHSDEVTAATLHATGSYFVTASLDATWAFYDIETGTCFTQVPSAGAGEGYTSAEFHPDGLILGTGTANSLVRMWEARQSKAVARFDGHKGAVRGLSFSENGYYLATAADDGVKVWDLRKLKNFKTLEAPAGTAAGAPLAVGFDFSGQNLAIGGSDARVVGVKQDWAALFSLSAALGNKGVSAVKWSHDSRHLFVGSTDHNLRIFGGDASAMAS